MLNKKNQTNHAFEKREIFLNDDNHCVDTQKGPAGENI